MTSLNPEKGVFKYTTILTVNAIDIRIYSRIKKDRPMYLGCSINNFIDLFLAN